MSNAMNINFMTRTYSNFMKYSKADGQTKATSFSDMLVEKSTAGKSVSEAGNVSTVSTKDMTMEEYKQYIYDRISQIPKHPTRMSESISINISDAGFEAMKNDPEYEAWVLNDLRTGWAQPDRWAGVCGGAYSTIYYGATKEECHAEMWSAGYQNGSGKSLFDGRVKDSFRERRTEQRKRMEEQLKKEREEKALREGTDVFGKNSFSAWVGDMVVSQPPSYFGFTYDTSISNKSKEEMTMDEYKQWVMNEMSEMPVSNWYRSTCVGGALTITEECFERMKTDPEWEKTVLGMVRKMYSCTGIMGTKMIGYQVIGATPEQCYGEGIPVKNGSSLSADNDESWWKKRHKRMKERMEEREEEVAKRAQMQRMAAFRAAEARASAVTTFSESVVGSWMNHSRNIY